MWRAKEIESSKVIDAVDSLNRLSPWQLLRNYPGVFIGLLQATMLGRVENRATPLWVLSLAWLWSAFRKINAPWYQALFMRDGSLLVTHPLWLIRRAMLRAIERCLGREDRHIIVIAADPGMGREVARAHPDAIVQPFTANAKLDPDAVRRGYSAAVDLVVAADLPISGLNVSVAQPIGERHVLLRLSSNQRDVDRSWEIAYFGGLGTRFCCRMWGTYIRLARKARPLFGRVFLKLLFVPFSPFLSIGASLVGTAMNFTGIILDFLVPGQSARRHDEMDEGRTIPAS
jgi:hypothetical protein